MWERHVWVRKGMTIKVATDMTIHVTLTAEDSEGKGHDVNYVWTLEEARAIKDALIRAVGAQNPVDPSQVKKIAEAWEYAPVLQPKGGFIGQGSTLSDTKCHCGSPGWGHNGACGTSGCNNVPA